MANLHSTRLPILLLSLISLFMILDRVTIAAVRSPSAPSATIYVTTAVDDDIVNGNCTLREAIQAANGDLAIDNCPAGSGTDTIGFANAYYITLGGSPLNDIVSDVIIDGGTAAGTVTVDGDDLLAPFLVASGKHLTIRNLAVRDGYSSNYGGAVSNYGTLTLNNCLFAGNHAAVDGGAIYNTNSGILNVDGCYFYDNGAESGGAIVSFSSNTTIQNSTFRENTADIVGGAVYGYDHLELVNDTFLLNQAGNAGGGVYVDGTAGIATSTFSDNSALGAGGGGLYNAGTLSFHSSIFANSIDGDDCVSSGTVSENGYSIVESGGCDLPAGPDPLLGPVREHPGTAIPYGSLPTMNLRPGSPAIDGGSPGSAVVPGAPDCPGNDARGYPRPRDGDGDGTARCDMGAYELHEPWQSGSPSYVVNTVDDVQDGVCGAGHCSLREAMAIASGTLGADTVIFALGTADTIELAGERLPDVSQPLTLSGPVPALASDRPAGGGSGLLTVDANSLNRHVRIYGSAGLTITHLSLVGGTVTGDGGSILVDRRGALTLRDCWLSGNSASARGGAVYNSGGNVSVGRCYVGHNEAGGNGGAFFQSGGSLHLFENSVTHNSAFQGGAFAILDGTANVYNGNTSNNLATSTGGAAYNEGTVTFSGESLAANNATYGGAIDSSGDLTLSAATLDGNSARARGGAVHLNTGGVLTVYNSTFSNNQADADGGAIYQSLGATSTLYNSTVSGNNALDYGGGFAAELGTVTILHSTFSDNSATTAVSGGGGGIWASKVDLTLYNNIIANSLGGGNCIALSCTVTNAGNLVEGGGCGNPVSGDPHLSALADNGGSTFTHALGKGSIALDSCDKSVSLGIDQRMALRPQDGDGDGVAACDVGAYERVSLQLEGEVQGDDFYLDWNDTGDIGYDFYFGADPYGSYSPAYPKEETWAVHLGIMPAANAYFYEVRGQTLGGLSNRLGFFTFTLTPGE